MKKSFIYFLALGLLLCGSPAFAKSNSEKLQNQIDNFESALENYRDDYIAAVELELPDSENDTRTDDEKNTELAQMKYDAAYSIYADVATEIQDIKSVTDYLNDFKKKDKKAVKISLQIMTAQLTNYKQDLEDGLALVYQSTPENSTVSAGLSAIETAIWDTEIYIDDNKTLFHDALEGYMYQFAITKKINYEYTLSQVDTIYDLYEEYYGESQITTFNDYRANAQAAYSEGLALYNRGIDGSEARDLQLLNRAINKWLTASDWISKIYSQIKELE